MILNKIKRLLRISVLSKSLNQFSKDSIKVVFNNETRRRLNTAKDEKDNYVIECKKINDNFLYFGYDWEIDDKLKNGVVVFKLKDGNRIIKTIEM